MGRENVRGYQQARLAVCGVGCVRLQLRCKQPVYDYERRVVLPTRGSHDVRLVRHCRSLHGDDLPVEYDLEAASVRMCQHHQLDIRRAT